MEVYTPSADMIVHSLEVDFTHRPNEVPVHITQIDNKLPILAISLYRDRQPWSLPSNARANIRLGKRDGTYVYNPALGVSSDGTIVYIEVTPQMVAVPGIAKPLLEIIIGQAAAGSSPIFFKIDPDSIQPGQVESSDEAKTLYGYVADAQAAREGQR